MAAMVAEGPKYPNITVQLTGDDSNPMYILGKVRGALRGAGVSAEEVTAFSKEASSAESYDAFLLVVIAWVDVA